MDGKVKQAHFSPLCVLCIQGGFYAHKKEIRTQKVQKIFEDNGCLPAADSTVF